jgi:hypothetical protein
MSYTVSVAIGAEGAWLSKLNGGPEELCIQLGSQHTLETLGEWLRNPDSFPNTYAKPASLPAHHKQIYFCTDTGKLVLHHPVKSACQFFDPSSEESLAKLVRTLKKFAERYDYEAQKEKQELPLPTEEQMANRTIYSKVMSAEGIERYKAPRSRYNVQAASAARSKELIANALGALKARNAE